MILLDGRSGEQDCILKVRPAGAFARPFPEPRVTVFDRYGIPVGPGVSSGDGCLAWRSLAPGSHTIVITAAGLAAAPAGAVVRPQTETEVMVTLDRASSSFSGRILDAASGAGVPGAMVRVVRGVEIARTITDISGCFQVTGLGPGDYMAVVQAGGFGHACQGLYLGAGGAASAEIALPPAGFLEGIVLDGVTTLPVPGAAVQMIVAGQAIFTAIADTRGRFNFPPLAPGRYLLVARAGGYGHCVRGVTIQPGAAARVEFALWPFCGSLAGKVRDRITGKAVAGAMISVQDSLGAPVAAAVADPQGEYCFPDLAEDAYLVTARAEGYQTALCGAFTQSEVETRLDLSMAAEAGTIEGTITAEGRPLPGAAVAFLDQDDVLAGTAITDADGHYASAGLSPGGYKVVVSASGCFAGRIGASVAPGFHGSASMEAAPGCGRIAGKVRIDRTQPGVVVIACTSTGLIVARDWADCDGGYSLAGLTPGRYRLLFLSPGYITASVETKANGSLVEIPPLDLQEAPALLTGMVRSGARPLAGAAVRAFSMAGGLLGQSLTDSAGWYFIAGLPAGAVELVCSAHRHAAAVLIVDFPPGGSQEWDPVLKPTPVQVLEVIRNGAGVPMPGVEVCVSDPEGRHLFTLLTNEEGFFLLRAWAREDPPWQISH